jgi:hypothetical protein
MAPIEPGEGSILVHPGALRKWAARAKDAAKDLEHTPTMTTAAGSRVGAGPCALRAVGASAVLCTRWSAVLDQLHVAVDGYGGKLRAAATAYEANDFAAMDVFGAPQPVPNTRTDR